MKDPEVPKDCTVHDLEEFSQEACHGLRQLKAKRSLSMLSARSSSTLDCYRELQAGKVQIPLLFECFARRTGSNIAPRNLKSSLNLINFRICDWPRSEVLRSFRVCEFGHAASHAALRGGGTSSC